MPCRWRWACCVGLCVGLWAFGNRLTARGDDWPRFRGPNGTGVAEATTLPVRWTDADYRWRVELPGMGYSSPVVRQGRVYVTSAQQSDASQFLVCLDAQNGNVVWQRQFASQAHRQHQFNCYASATPALDAQRVFFVWVNPEHYQVAALDQRTGEELWRRDLGPFVAEHGYGASPMVVDDLLILPNDQDGPSSLIALDCATGQDRWIAPRRACRTAYSTPCLYQPAEGPAQLITTSWAHGISGIDPRTGKTLWELPVFSHRAVGSPLVVGDLVFASAGEGGIGKQMFAVRPANPARNLPAEVVYELQGSLPYVPTPVAFGNLVFLWFDRGVVTCLDAPSGQVRWRERIGGDYFGSPVRVGDRLYAISRSGEMVVLAAAEQFQLLARFDLGERSHSTPAVADGVMYLRTISHVMAIAGSDDPAATR